MVEVNENIIKGVEFGHNIAPYIERYYKYVNLKCFYNNFTCDFRYLPSIWLSNNKTFIIKKRVYINDKPYIKWFDIVDDYRGVSIDFYYPDNVNKGDYIKIYYKYQDITFTYSDWKYEDWVHGDNGLCKEILYFIIIDWLNTLECIELLYQNITYNDYSNFKQHQKKYNECLKLLN